MASASSTASPPREAEATAFSVEEWHAFNEVFLDELLDQRNKAQVAFVRAYLNEILECFQRFQARIEREDDRSMGGCFK